MTEPERSYDEMMRMLETFLWVVDTDRSTLRDRTRPAARAAQIVLHSSAELLRVRAAAYSAEALAQLTEPIMPRSCAELAYLREQVGSGLCMLGAMDQSDLGDYHHVIALGPWIFELTGMFSWYRAAVPLDPFIARRAPDASSWRVSGLPHGVTVSYELIELVEFTRPNTGRARSYLDEREALKIVETFRGVWRPADGL